MLDAKLTRIGKLTIEDGQMHAIGFDTDKPMMCREVAAHVCVWAIGQLQEELARILAAPGGTMAVDSECEHCGANEIHGLGGEDCRDASIRDSGFVAEAEIANLGQFDEPQTMPVQEALKDRAYILFPNLIRFNTEPMEPTITKIPHLQGSGIRILVEWQFPSGVERSLVLMGHPARLTSMQCIVEFRLLWKAIAESRQEAEPSSRSRTKWKAGPTHYQIARTNHEQ